jgi:CheY-like chemotaxis protein
MKKVLLIEDDQVLQDMYRDKFTHDGFTVEVAKNGNDGLALMKSFNPDVVLLDLILPDTTGFNILDSVKEDPQLKDIPIVVLTNIYADHEDLVKNKGANAVLLKANTTPDLVAEKIKQIVQ